MQGWQAVIAIGSSSVGVRKEIGDLILCIYKCILKTYGKNVP